MSPLLAQVVASLERTNRLRGELATKAAVLRDAATALRTGADAHTVAAALVKHLHVLHGFDSVDPKKFT